tara:strand:- start:1713 stop:2483 length:771 start_codon:yes stop_codon:yes gene_type:complete
MIHVLCSRWGETYGPIYVNRLFNMVKKHMPFEFIFHCQTQDAQGIDERISILPFLRDLPESTPDEMFASNNWLNNKPRLWDRPKLNYFKPNGWGLDGLRIALDLDMIIHNDMTPLINMFNRPIVGRSWWHNRNHEARPDWKRRNGAYTNGGFYMWKDNQLENIWNDCLKNAEKIYHIYTGGTDNFISQRHLDLFDFVPSSMYYSFNRGCEWPNDLDKHIIRKDKIMCAFNTDPGDATNLELHDAIKIYDEVKQLWQ